MLDRPKDPNDLNAWFDNPVFNALQTSRLGVVVGGSLSRGLVVRLDPSCEIESLAVGRYVVIHGQTKRFFCMINDITLQSTNPSIQNEPPNIDDPFIRDVYIGTAAFGTVTVTPMLTIEDGQPLPVKTIPGHFVRVDNATAEDVNDVFGAEDHLHFNVGNPLELEDTNINLNLKRLVERSVGVFGKSGTGKSFLTRVIMAGVISRDIAVSLIFDMHNDYGWEAPDERGPKAKGLAQICQGKVVILTLDAESSHRRKANFDFEIKLGYDEIEPMDIAMLASTMNLSDTMIDAAYALHKIWGKNWIHKLLKATVDDLDYITENTTIGSGTLSALTRRLQRFERWGFLVPESTSDSVQQIINILVEQQKSVVLEFGRYGNSVDAYILVANYLTRRIHEAYVEKVERALGDSALEPPQLMITIEEAHKFLDPQIASQTIFGIIARELRKYNVTLLIVDQRPSGIDEEVMSQIGTRVTALLDNERDINAVLNGISGAAGLREVLARLETKQQAIIMGHAVPMPVVIRPRTYNQEFYDAIQGQPVNQAEIRKGLGSGGKRRI